jgi:hypothetical protein
LPKRGDRARIVAARRATQSGFIMASRGAGLRLQGLGGIAQGSAKGSIAISGNSGFAWHPICDLGPRAGRHEQKFLGPFFRKRTAYFSFRGGVQRGSSACPPGPMVAGKCANRAARAVCVLSEAFRIGTYGASVNWRAAIDPAACRGMP